LPGSTLPAPFTADSGVFFFVLFVPPPCRRPHRIFPEGFKFEFFFSFPFPAQIPVFFFFAPDLFASNGTHSRHFVDSTPSFLFCGSLETAALPVQRACFRDCSPWAFCSPSWSYFFRFLPLDNLSFSFWLPLVTTIYFPHFFPPLDKKCRRLALKPPPVLGPFSSCPLQVRDSRVDHLFPDQDRHFRLSIFPAFVGYVTAPTPFLKFSPAVFLLLFLGNFSPGLFPTPIVPAFSPPRKGFPFRSLLFGF